MRLPILIVSLTLLLSACGDSPPATGDGIADRGSGIGEWWSDHPRAEWAEFEQVESADPWFEVYRIRDHIYAIYEPRQFEEVISFLILGERNALLFDTGLGFGDIRKVTRSLTSLPIIVLNSHSHYDHIGGNWLFDDILGLETDYGKANARGLPNVAVAEYASPAWIHGEPPNGFAPAQYDIKPYAFKRWVENGQFIDLGGISLEIIATPGHSPDSISLMDHYNRLLFTGDTFYLAPLYSHIEGASFENYRNSAAKLASLTGKLDALITSHNVPVADPAYLKAMAQAFEAVANDARGYELVDGTREYRFENFSILTRDPP